MLNSIFRFRKQSYYLLAAIFVAVFLIVSNNVFAACGDNNNSNNPSRIEGDDGQAACESIAAWKSSGGDSLSICWKDGRDNPYLCCGDDTGENFTFEKDNDCTSPPCPVSFVDGPFGVYTVCCDKSSDCVQGYGCYDKQQVHNNLNPGGNDNKAYCDDTGWWKECDLAMSTCGAVTCGSSSGIRAGESSVGEYPNQTTYGCCGDDSGEYYVTTMCPGATTQQLCCNSSSDKISQNNTCVSACVPKAPISPAFKTNYCVPDYGGTDSYVEAYLIDDATDETGFYVYRNTINNPSTANLIQTLPSLSGTSQQIRFTDNTGLNCTYYYYFISSYNTAGESARMMVGSNGIGFHNQTHPNNVHTTQITNDSITWSWDALSGISSYGLCVHSIDTCVIYPSPTTNTSYTATGLTPGTNYDLIVYGIYTNGLSNGNDCYSCWGNLSEGSPTIDNDEPIISVSGNPGSWQYTDATANRLECINNLSYYKHTC